MALTNLPPDILVSLFATWLPIDDFCRVDSALCDQSKRPQFLKILSENVVGFSSGDFVVPLSTIAWMIIRNIVVDDATFRGDREYSDPFPITSDNNTVLTKIKSLQIVGGQDISAEYISTLIPHMTSVTHFYLHNCCYSEEAVEKITCAVATNCGKSLCSLKFLANQGPNAAAINAVADGLPNLTSFCVAVHGFFGKDNLDNSAMIKLVRSCKKLNFLIINGLQIESLDDEFIHELSVNCPDLTNLSFQQRALVTNKSLFSLAQNSRKLEYIYFRNSVNPLDNSGWFQIFEHCTALKQVLFHCEVLITDELFHFMSIHCNSLVILDIVCCPLLTGKICEYISIGFPKLKHLKLSRGKGASLLYVEAMVKLHKKRPDIEVDGDWPKPEGW